ncbi:hypothetical protein GCM10010503_28200 [Streptomyces lucensis JCM 4490]|uniref:Uncharacterized protein n=1 Tax=Streptomyces lucensis JCM 4490 TaxID=1306176 RepID=A0A918J8M5_9ACTN|nr:hypothetical protein GCM10010503_28200 [Streptomyces lucensis JCM 4490]
MVRLEAPIARRRAFAPSSKRPRQSGQPARNTTGIALRIPAKAAATVISLPPDTADSFKPSLPSLKVVRPRRAAAAAHPWLSARPAPAAGAACGAAS